MIPDAMKFCSICRHSRRVQQGPHFWNNDCSLKQADFPNAADCGLYEPLSVPESAETGLAYVWDGEFEGPA